MAEQSDGDDQLHRTLKIQFKSGFTENLENTITNYIFMAVYRNMCVVRRIEKRSFSNKSVRVVRF